MDLSTRYMGLTLKNPLVVGASPLVQEIESIRRLEDAGASAVVLHSLFEEQLSHDAEELSHHLQQGTEQFAEALSYFPEPPGGFKLGPDEYLEHIRKAKAAVDIPVIASLNGTTVGGWTEFAKMMQNAGADGIELNIYYLPTDPNVSGADIEKRYIDIVRAVKSAVSIPLAVKLCPFFSAPVHMFKQLDAAGAGALVLFNRFYQPDIDLEALEVVPNLVLSHPHELRLPLRWVAFTYGNVKCSLAASSGIGTARDVLKAMMAGADVVQMVSVLLRKGPRELSIILGDMQVWMEDYEYESIEQMKGSMSAASSGEHALLSRANYMQMLNSYV